MKQVCRNLLLSCFCCHSLPSSSCASRSSWTKTAYSFVFSSCLLLLFIAAHIPGATRHLPFCKDDDSLLCRNYSSFPATYRICFTYILFFTVMSACTLGVSSSRNPRAVIQNGFWFPKVVVIVLLLVATAYIPHGLFDIVFMYFGLIFVFSFNLFEMFLYIQLLKGFAYICRFYCFRQASACMKFIITFLAILLLGAGAGIFIILFILYCNCKINTVFTVLNMSLSHLISLGTFCLKLHKKDWNSMLEGSVLTTHVMFITWSAISNNPRDECNPSPTLAHAFFAANNFSAMTFAGMSAILAVEYFIRTEPKEKPNSLVYVEERGREFCNIWGKRKLIQVIEPEDSTNPPENIIYRSTDPDDDEYDRIKYYWHAMHNLYLQALFYFMICFTNNYMYSRTPSDMIFHNEAAMWFKITSSWFCMISFVCVEILPETTRVHVNERSS